MITYAFIDAANLFRDTGRYGGWEIDPRKLASYLRETCGAEKIFYFSGTEMHLRGEAERYRRLASLGYLLLLKPVKYYQQKDGYIKKKANCDVDMTFLLMKEREYFDRLIFLSGDGDFLPVLRYLRESGKEVIVLAKARKTSRDIRRAFGNNFIDFDLLARALRTEEGSGERRGAQP